MGQPSCVEGADSSRAGEALRLPARQASASWLSGGFSQRQIMPQAAASLRGDLRRPEATRGDLGRPGATRA
eukprot:scaffold110938_cov54-Phaeocystis_antarctica.AAC.2